MMVRRNRKARVAKAAPVVPKVTPVDKVTPVESVEPVKQSKSIEDLSWPELRSLAQKNGISVYGKKAADIKEELAAMGL